MTEHPCRSTKVKTKKNARKRMHGRKRNPLVCGYSFEARIPHDILGRQLGRKTTSESFPHANLISSSDQSKANTTTSVIRRDNFSVARFCICITACDTQPELLLLAILLFRYHLHLHIHHSVYSVQPTKSFPPSMLYADS